MTTLREHLEAIRDLHGEDRSGWCEWCEHPYPCMDHRHAVAALELLDSADRLTNLYGKPRHLIGGNHALIHDPRTEGRSSPDPEQQTSIPPRAHDYTYESSDLFPYESERVVDERMADSIAEQKRQPDAHEALLEEILLQQERMFGETGPLP